MARLCMALAIMSLLVAIGCTGEKSETTSTPGVQEETAPDTSTDESQWATHIGDEEKRHQIWDELCAAEDRAAKEAAARYPRGNLIGKALNELTDKYTAEIFEKYQITKEDRVAIVLEGYKKNWPIVNWKGK